MKGSKRSKNKKIFEILGRNKIIGLFITCIVILCIITIALVVQAIKENMQVTDTTYTESGAVDYRVYLKENKFFKQDYLDKNKQYIASLIDYVAGSFTYQLRSSEPNKDYNYVYKVVADTNVIDSSTGNSIYKLSEELVKEKKATFNSRMPLSIRENVKIDYNKYNNIIKKFISTYSLDDIDSTVTIKMFVSVSGVTRQSDYNNTPVASLTIPLTTNTVAIDIESNAVNATDMNIYKEIARKDYLYIAVLTFALTIMVIIELGMFLNSTKDEDALYETRIKKILTNYDSYIQRIDNEFDFTGYQELEMKSFEDLLQVRDTINEPILMIQRNKPKETNFLIPSKGKVVYIYKLTLKDIKKEKQEKENKK